MKERIIEILDSPKNQEDWEGEIVEEAEEVRAMRMLSQGLKRFGCKDTTELPVQERYLMAAWIREHTSVGHKWLTEQFCLKSTGGMRSSISKMKKRIVVEPQLKAHINALLQQNSV